MWQFPFLELLRTLPLNTFGEQKLRLKVGLSAKRKLSREGLVSLAPHYLRELLWSGNGTSYMLRQLLRSLAMNLQQCSLKTIRLGGEDYSPLNIQRLGTGSSF